MGVIEENQCITAVYMYIDVEQDYST